MQIGGRINFSARKLRGGAKFQCKPFEGGQNFSAQPSQGSPEATGNYPKNFCRRSGGYVSLLYHYVLYQICFLRI